MKYVVKYDDLLLKLKEAVVFPSPATMNEVRCDEGDLNVRVMGYSRDQEI